MCDMYYNIMGLMEEIEDPDAQRGNSDADDVLVSQSLAKVKLNINEKVEMTVGQDFIGRQVAKKFEQEAFTGEVISVAVAGNRVRPNLHCTPCDLKCKHYHLMCACIVPLYVLCLIFAQYIIYSYYLIIILNIYNILYIYTNIILYVLFCCFYR
jgi:hypothetical protein